MLKPNWTASTITQFSFKIAVAWSIMDDALNCQFAIKAFYFLGPRANLVVMGFKAHSFYHFHMACVTVWYTSSDGFKP